MSADGSITHCLELLCQGDAEAARTIWQRFFPQLVQQARRQLGPAVCRAAVEEDVALSALDRFCRAAQAGDFPDLADRDSLWRLLLQITNHRALDLARRERRLRRGGVDAAASRRLTGGGVATLTAREPGPELTVQMAEAYRQLMDRLDDASLQALAAAKMEGCTNQELAQRLGCSVRTVERRLRLIRDVWRAEESR